jgi:N-dimethylarginine dimethylaminohydrolase
MRAQQIDLHITDETSELETVILGIAESPGPPRLTNAKAREADREGRYPMEADLASDLAAFEKVLVDNGVTVLRPANIEGLNQIFVRDIGFVIDDHFVTARMKVEERRREIAGLKSILTLIDKSRIVDPPETLCLEGGDVMPFGDVIFVGTGERTRQAGVSFLRETFPQKEIISFEMRYGEDDPYKDILHLDCAFQPVGEGFALFYEDGFVSPQPIIDIFGRDKLIPVSSVEMYEMFPNIFSLTPSKVVSCSAFTRINDLLVERGIEVLTIPYDKVSIIGGLLRCSTLPLSRKEN